MKNLIFSFIILLASVSIANAQVTLNEDYEGTATNIYMGARKVADRTMTTYFDNNEMSGLNLNVHGHSIDFDDYPLFVDNGDGTYTLANAQKGTGTVYTPGGGSYYFDVVNINSIQLSSGVLSYYFEAYVPSLNMKISFNFN